MKGIWCRKIGMTQLFKENGVHVPVTVLEAANWRVTQVKPAALQIGLVREKFVGSDFSPEWFKNLKRYFYVLREVPRDTHLPDPVLGAAVLPEQVLAEGDFVDVSGNTIGRGFQGGVKRHGFSGGRGSHGDKLGRGPGSVGFMRSRGRVIKGWRMAGHMGAEKRTVRHLTVISATTHHNVPTVIVKGSVPGKSGTLLFVHKV